MIKGLDVAPLQSVKTSKDQLIFGKAFSGHARNPIWLVVLFDYRLNEPISMICSCKHILHTQCHTDLMGSVLS